MAEAVLMGTIAGVKLAVFLVVLVYAYLADISFKAKCSRWLNVMAVAFIIMAIGEFIHMMGEANPEFVPWPWIASHDNLFLFFDVLNVGVVISLGMFLRYIDKNAKEYR